MILKVQGDFGMADFARIVGKITPYFKFIYNNDIMYIALMDITKKQEAQNIVSKTFRPVKSYYIKEINETNILDEEDSVAMWCKDNFVALDRQRFEIENQEKLCRAWAVLDNMEIDLQKKLKEHKEN